MNPDRAEFEAAIAALAAEYECRTGFAPDRIEVGRGPARRLTRRGRWRAWRQLRRATTREARS